MKATYLDSQGKTHSVHVTHKHSHGHVDIAHKPDGKPFIVDCPVSKEPQAGHVTLAEDSTVLKSAATLKGGKVVETIEVKLGATKARVIKDEDGELFALAVADAEHALANPPAVQVAAETTEPEDSAKVV